MSGGTGIGGQWSRGPACGDATVEPIVSASQPIPARHRGSDPQTREDRREADTMTVAMRQRGRGGDLDRSMSSNAKTALILASIALVFFAGVVVRHWLW